MWDKKEETLDKRSKEYRDLKEQEIREEAVKAANTVTLDGQRPKSMNMAELANDRPIRKKTAGDADIIVTHNIPDHYVARVVNERNVQKKLDLGYSFVNDQGVIVGDETTNRSRRPISSKSMIVNKDGGNGNPEIGYLMIQRKEWYEEDKKIKAKAVDRTVEQLRENDKGEGRYGDGLKTA